MIGYVTVGTNRFDDAAKFYDSLFETIGAGRAMEAPEKVDAFCARAIALGAADEGVPGPRSDSFYAGYFRDLDGNKLNAFCFVTE